MFEGANSYSIPIRYGRRPCSRTFRKSGLVADDIASMTCFLASDDASYMTGSIITIDGVGLRLYRDFKKIIDIKGNNV